MVWAMSRIGRRAVFRRSWRAGWTQIAVPMSSGSSVATRTLARVTIAWFQRPRRTITPRQTAATIAGLRPETYHATSAANAITSHHGAVVRTASSGLRMTLVSTSFTAIVIGEKVSVIQPAIAFTGSWTETWTESGNVVASTKAGAMSPAPR